MINRVSCNSMHWLSAESSYNRWTLWASWKRYWELRLSFEIASRQLSNSLCKRRIAWLRWWAPEREKVCYLCYQHSAVSVKLVLLWFHWLHYVWTCWFGARICKFYVQNETASIKRSVMRSNWCLWCQSLQLRRGLDCEWWERRWLSSWTEYTLMNAIWCWIIKLIFGRSCKKWVD